MKNLLRTLTVIGSLWAGSALAADNALVVTPGVGVTVRSVDVGAGVQAPGHVLVNSSGAAFGLAATPIFMAPGTGQTFPVSLATWAGGTLGAMANYGTSPGAVLVPGVNAFVTNSNANGQTTMANSSPVVIASNQTAVPVDTIVTPSSNFAHPSATTYASGQLVANSATAGSVVPLSWTAARNIGGNFYIRRVRIMLSSKSVTLTSFRVHFYTVTPTIANGDGAAWSTTLANYVCKMDVPVTSWEAGTDVSSGIGVPTSGDGNECNVVAAGGTQTLFGLVEARAAYVGTAGETVTVVPEIHQN